MRRVGLFVPSLAGGGAERVMVNLAAGFHDRGSQVDLVVGDPQGPYRAHVPDGVRIVDLAAPRVRSMIVRLSRYLRRENVDALLSAMDGPNVAALTARRLAGTRTPVVVSVHGTVSQVVQHSPHARMRLLPPLMRRLYRQADAIVAVSAGAASDLARTTGIHLGRIQVVHNPIVTPVLRERARSPVQHPWLTGSGVGVVLGVGRLVPEKGFDTLIGALAHIRDRHQVRLVILGEGEQRGRLEALVRRLGLGEHVSMPGFVENPYSYMYRAKVLVLSSRREGFGNVLVEAMAVGTPVVATDCNGGPAEILDHGRFGRLVPVADDSALADAVSATLQDPPDAGSLQARAAAFTVEASVDRYLKVLRSVTGSRASAGTGSRPRT